MKKPSSIVAFLITFLLAAAVCTLGDEDPKFVRDSDGHPVEYNKKYFIQPIKSNNGGGLVPAATTVLPFCPLGVTQTLLPYQPGLPVTFKLPYALMEENLKTEVATVIEFESDVWPVCNEFSKIWKFDDSSSAAKEPAILIGGKQHDQNSWFKFEKVREGTRVSIYKLTTSTGTVGTIPGPWLSAPQLVLTNDTAKILLVTIKKVEDTPTVTTSTSRVEKLGLRMFPFY